MTLADSELNIMNSLVLFVVQGLLLWMFCKFPLREIVLLFPQKLATVAKHGEGTPAPEVAYSGLREFLAFRFSSASG